MLSKDVNEFQVAFIVKPHGSCFLAIIREFENNKTIYKEYHHNQPTMDSSPDKLFRASHNYDYLLSISVSSKKERDKWDTTFS